MAMVPRPAATLILLRGGLEVLMLQRTQSAVFLGGAYVFPGGSLDPQDASMDRVIGLTDAQASERLKLPSGGIAYYVAAIRECFEEAGILLACDARGALVSASRAEQLMPYRKRPFRELLEKEDLYIPAGDLAYFGHWITAPGRSRRFDARFFVALAPQGQQGSHDADETVHDVWISPREALERGARGEIELVNATQQSLKELARFSDPHAAFEYARSMTEIEENRACCAQGREGPKIFRRADPPYFEIHWSDPEETGETSYDIIPGTAKRLDRWVTRLTAPNPGIMTGPGTNSYIVGGVAVIDPGPRSESVV
jgi:8-oxo-dGTP pyrophosphatase MutT (NUDIX family)